MKSTDAWMPLHIGDYLGDTTRLSTIAHGAYLLILMDYWRNGPPPDDNETLAAIAKMGDTDWLAMRPRLEPFFSIKDGQWRNKRADTEKARANGLYRQKIRASEKGVKARKDKANSKPPDRAVNRPVDPAVNTITIEQSIRTSGTSSETASFLIEGEESESHSFGPSSLEAPAPASPQGATVGKARVDAVITATVKGMPKMNLQATEQQKTIAWIHRTQHNSETIVTALLQGLMQPAGSADRTAAMQAMEKFIKARRADEGRKPNGRDRTGAGRAPVGEP